MMHKYLIINVATFEIKHVYCDNNPAYSTYWEYPLDQYEHVEVPMEMATQYIRASKDRGKWRFYEDRDKKIAFQKEMLENLLIDVRYKRNILLQESDWIVSVPDAPFTDAKKAEWKVYRQQLRDITKTITRYDQVVKWPSPPS